MSGIYLKCDVCIFGYFIIGENMSDGITLYCPFCGELKALKKEYDALTVKVKNQSLKHPEDWYETNLPVYTCSGCKKQSVIEQVNKW